MLAAIVVAAAGWIGTWASAPSGSDPSASFVKTTLREVVHTSIGGNAVRVRFTNRFGNAPLVIDAASIAVASDGVAAVPGTLRDLTFGGARSITIAPHADASSDAVPIDIAQQTNLLISLYVAGPSGPATYHHLAYQHLYSATGDVVDSQSAAAFAVAGKNWYFIDGVDVSGVPARGAVVALGDSITNGQGSTVDGNNRWADDLAQRLLALPPSRRLGVLNAGIDGDRILISSDRFGPDALARFDADVLAQPGVRDVIVLLGINDIQQTPHQYDPSAIEGGLAQLAAMAHAKGIRIIGATITPYGGWTTYEPAGEQTRQAVNRFIRTSKIFDGVADFDPVVRDPNDPSRLAAGYDSGDHLHPNAAAYRAMANAIDLGSL